nr:uncharacterized protein LOC112939361 [Oryza sativa Japonica Group]
MREVRNTTAPFFVLLHKEVLLSTNDLPSSLPSVVLDLLQDFEDVFPDEIPAGLPPLRGIEHQIDLVPGASLPNRPAYRTNPAETKEIQRQVKELLDKGYVRESLSPCAVPVLLVPKKDGSWRMCVDCRALNAITVRYRHPIPRLDDMLDELSGSIIFTKIDLRSGYHQIRMKLGDEWKTAFKTKIGLYEWLVMPFGLTNAPSTFMRLMNHVLRAFIGFVVSADGIQVDEEKVKAIKDWPTPVNGQGKLNRRHAKWIEFIETFPYVVQHKRGKDNIVADALSRRCALITQLDTKVLGLESIKTLYAVDADFNEPFSRCIDGKGWDKYYVHDGFLFRTNKICIPACSIRQVLLQEAHAGGLAGHFGVKKTLDMPSDHFFWPHMRRDVQRHVGCCIEQVNLDATKRSDFIKRLHAETRKNIEKKSAQYAKQANKGMMECTNKHGMMMDSARQIYARNLDVHERGKTIQLP